MPFLNQYLVALLSHFLTVGLFALVVGSPFAIVVWCIALRKGIRKTSNTREAVTLSFAIPIAIISILIFRELIKLEVPELLPGRNPIGLQVLQSSPLAYCCSVATTFIVFGLYIWFAHFIGKKAEVWLRVDLTKERRKESEEEERRKELEILRRHYGD